MGLMFSAANSAGIISSNVYPSHTAPRFFQGHDVAVGFALMAVVCAIVINIATRNENVRRDALYGPVAVNGSDANPNKVLTPDQSRRWGLEGLPKTEIIELGDKHPGTVFRGRAPSGGPVISPAANVPRFTPRIPICHLASSILYPHPSLLTRA